MDEGQRPSYNQIVEVNYQNPSLKVLTDYNRPVVENLRYGGSVNKIENDIDLDKFLINGI